MSAGKWCGFGVLVDEGENKREGTERIRREMRNGFGDRIKATEES